MIDWQIFWITFTTIFLAEIGDKTQLGVLLFAANTNSPMTIFIAASVALIAATSIGVLAGTLLAKYIDPKFLRMGGGALFIAVGIWIIFNRE